MGRHQQQAGLARGPRPFQMPAVSIYPSGTGDLVYGVMGIAAADSPLDSFETSICSLSWGKAPSLWKTKRIWRRRSCRCPAKNEQLRANLLRSISHDLRTPLTAISGNASNLLSNHSAIDEATRLQIYADIYDDSMWLINLVENLLAVTRIEDGRMNLRMETELVSEVISEALRHISRQSVEHSVTAESTDDLLLARMDGPAHCAGHHQPCGQCHQIHAKGQPDPDSDG